jgi:hypothetical protein
VPESEEWKRQRAQRAQNKTSTKSNLFEKIRSRIKNHWKIFILATLLMTALNFIVHGK